MLAALYQYRLPVALFDAMQLNAIIWTIAIQGKTIQLPAN
jgi:hypothetical protein